jgi:D-arabinose 1-dehydrogenase-like Zn-dependent alcohol dehydrogenase
MQTDPKNPSKPNMTTLGSEIDGAFAQYVAIRSSESFVINCKWTDVELGSIPCSYSTAEVSSESPIKQVHSVTWCPNFSIIIN